VTDAPLHLIVLRILGCGFTTAPPAPLRSIVSRNRWGVGWGFTRSRYHIPRAHHGRTSRPCHPVLPGHPHPTSNIPHQTSHKLPHPCDTPIKPLSAISPLLHQALQAHVGDLHGLLGGGPPELGPGDLHALEGRGPPRRAGRVPLRPWPHEKATSPQIGDLIAGVRAGQGDHRRLEVSRGPQTSARCAATSSIAPSSLPISSPSSLAPARRPRRSGRPPARKNDFRDVSSRGLKR